MTSPWFSRTRIEKNMSMVTCSIYGDDTGPLNSLNGIYIGDYIGDYFTTGTHSFIRTRNVTTSFLVVLQEGRGWIPKVENQIANDMDTGVIH